MNQPLLEVIKALNDANVDYVIVGGVAVNLHGYARNTLDLDVIIAFDQTNVHHFVTCMRGLGYLPRTPVDPEMLRDASQRKLWKERNMVALSLWNSQPPYSVVDVFIEHPIDYAELKQHALQFEVPDGTIVRACGLDHLIKLKEDAGRPKDLEDLRWMYAVRDARQKND